MFDKPALLGGQPLFTEKIPLVRPALPSFVSISSDIATILSSGMVTKGQYLRTYEEEVAAYLGIRHAIAVSSCTAGLMLVYKSLGLTGDVIVPSFTFMATVSALIWAGLRPVFVDVVKDTANIDPDAIEAAITPQVSSIVAVHNFGNPADIDKLTCIAKRHKLRLIFDAAHGFGTLHRGIPVGRQGDVHVFSTSPTKLVVTGEGGIVATDDDILADTVRKGREYGMTSDYDSIFAGINARMPEFNAIMGLHSLRMLRLMVARRNEIAVLYRKELEQLPGFTFQTIHPDNRSSYKDFSIRIDPAKFGVTRGMLAFALAEENIDTRKYYSPPVHTQTAYSQYGQGLYLPNTAWLAANSLALPIWSNMEDSMVINICRAIKRIWTHADAIGKISRGLLVN